ncbi:hypothetical protein JOL79_06910 [Microbispora sp. RL4-1S]|uniref:Lipoprotein n=1 Tax=Microbispora oryzae TaxID=2806554 RepID=A0A941AIV2_9ACTN|nr:hypothetical protein [Microbispora oryzae]MBP2703528.1 hypothetical protein [Microbispora oryzae]
MRLRALAALAAAALTVSGCGASAAPSAPAPAAPNTPPPAPCSAAAAYVQPFRDRALAAFLDSTSRRQVQQALNDAGTDAGEVIGGAGWKTALAACEADDTARRQAAELRMFAVDISLAALQIDTGKPLAEVQAELISKLDTAVTTP